MFLSVIALALVTGALAGGGIPRLADLRLKLVWVLGVALALRVGAVLLAGTDVGRDLPVGAAFVVAYLLLFVFLAANYKVPGLQVAAVGIGLNTLAVILNAGQMPIWANAFEAAGFTPAALIGDPFHFLIASGTRGRVRVAGRRLRRRGADTHSLHPGRGQHRRHPAGDGHLLGDRLLHDAPGGAGALRSPRCRRAAGDPFPAAALAAAHRGRRRRPSRRCPRHHWWSPRRRPRWARRRSAPSGRSPPTWRSSATATSRCCGPAS